MYFGLSEEQRFFQESIDKFLEGKTEADFTDRYGDYVEKVAKFE